MTSFLIFLSNGVLYSQNSTLSMSSKLQLYWEGIPRDSDKKAFSTVDVISNLRFHSLNLQAKQLLPER